MRIYFYRYNSIFEPDCIDVFRKFGIDVFEEKVEITKKDLTQAERIDLVVKRLIDAADAGDPFMFVFSINFYPAISDVCNKFHIFYACWSVDCPVTELFAKQIKNEYNRVFLFDRAQYDRIVKHNPQGVFYLPLGTNVERLDKTIATIGSEDRRSYSADISFVGSLYSEKNHLKNMKLTDKTRGYIDGLEAAQMNVYGYNFIEEALTDEVVREIKGSDLSDYKETMVEPIDFYTAAHSYIGFELAERERIKTLNMLSRDFSVDLYTRSDTTLLPKVHFKGAANSLTEMPKIFNLSKINLNITMRPIQTGLPLRIFDVCGSGGFLMTNYQSEIPEIYEPGVDIETYSSLDELHEKCAYYLAHEEERQKIAKNGYEKTKAKHTVEIRMHDMIAKMLGR